MKGTRLRLVDRLELDLEGAVGNRRFYVIDDRARMLNGKRLGRLQQVLAECPAGSSTLVLEFPDKTKVQGPVELGDPIATRFFSRDIEARLVNGPFSTALSEHTGQSIRLVQAPCGSVDRGVRASMSLISRASLSRLAVQAGERDVDFRRFRMLVEVDGVSAHAEDGWVGTTSRVGEVLVRWNGHVGRCVVTTRHPETGNVDLPTLKILSGYRRHPDTTEPLPFGIYGEVLKGGLVRTGDRVTRARA